MNKDSLKKIGFTLLTAAIVSTSLLSSISDAANGKYKLKTSAKTFISTEDASKGVNIRGTYGAGDYFIFRELNDYVNISRVEGVPGAWIRKTDEGTTVVSNSQTKVEKEQNVSLNGNKLKLSSPTKIYLNASDANSERNSRGTYAAGEYYIYKSFNGSYNISKVANQPGGWIKATSKIVTESPKPITNTEKTKSVSETPKTITNTETTTNITEDGKYKVTSTIAGYQNASFAKNSINAITTLRAGEYHIYKTFDGMLNLSKQKNVPGAWINPNSQNVSSKVSSDADYSLNIGQQIVAEARKYIGSSYVYGGSIPSTGFDCSGLSSYVLRKVKGTTLARSSSAQSQGGQYVSLSNLQAGDLVFFGYSSTNIFHVGVYNGNGGYIHASDYGVGVIESSINSSFFSRNFQFAKRY